MDKKLPAAPPAPRLWLTVILPFGLGYLIAMAYRSVTAILAHPLATELHLNPLEIGFVTSTFMLTFALAQLPLGVLLDSLGARRTQALFFSIGAVGIVIFGLGSSVASLSLGRAILGIGMAGGLMAAFKAIAEWVSKDRIPFYNSIVLAAGGIGALVATTPSKLFELEFGWRALCITLAVLTFAIAALILVANRDRPSDQADAVTLRDQIVGLKAIYADRFFWQIAPLFTFSLGGFIAMQGLWLGPWLQRVVGLTPLQSANYLLVIAIAMTLGFLSGGLFSWLAKRTGRSLATIVAIGIAIHIATQALIIGDILSDTYAVWFVYGYFAQITLVNYAILSQYFGHAVSGRALTAVNIFIFLFAFAVQYLFGAVLHWWPAAAGSATPVIAYRVAFAGVVALELLGLAWFVLLGRKAPAEGQARPARGAPPQ